MVERAGQLTPTHPTPTMAPRRRCHSRPAAGLRHAAGLGDTPAIRTDQIVSEDGRGVRPDAECSRRFPPGRRAGPQTDRPRGIAPLVLGAVLILAVAGAVFALTRPSAGATVTVPILQGMSEDSAQTLANQKGLLVSFDSRTADDPAGLIVSQSPKPGFFLGRGDSVRLVVSKGPKPIALPGVVGPFP